MAGQDQSANLGGMLTGIAETMGTMDDAYTPVLQAAMKPRGDMNDPAHLEALAQWASSNGDAQAAQMYMTQARQVRAEQKELKAKQDQLVKQQSANAVTAQYKMALESGDAATIKKAEDALMAGANAHGYSAQDRMNAASSAVKAQNDAAFTEAERKRTADERVATEKFSQVINGTDDIDAVLEAVKTAPPELAEQAQRMANTRVSFLKAVEERRKVQELNASDVSTEFTMPEGLPQKIAAPLEAEHARIVQLSKDKKNADGTWKEQGRQAVDRAMTKLLDDAQRAAMSLAVAEESDKRQRLRSIDHKRANVSISNPTKQQTQEYTELLNREYEEAGTTEPGKWWGTNPKQATYQDVVARFRADQMAALDAEAESIMGPQSKPESKPDEADEGGIVDVASEQEALSLKPGTRFRLPDGRTGTAK